MFVKDSVFNVRKTHRQISQCPFHFNRFDPTTFRVGVSISAGTRPAMTWHRGPEIVLAFVLSVFVVSLFWFCLCVGTLLVAAASHSRSVSLADC